MNALRSLLFVPGNSPSMVQNAPVYGADAVILDLEDAVSPAQKDAARILVAEALASLDFGPGQVVVRINPLDAGGADDLALVAPQGPDAVLLPKAQTPQDVQAACALLARHEPAPGRVALLALIETPLGVLSSLALAQADPRVAGLAFGAEDFTAAMGVARTKAGHEIAFARSQVATAAQAAGVLALDTPFTDTADPEGLASDTRSGKALGFKGKLCIHPLQIDGVHQVFNPAPAEIDWAVRVTAAFRAALAEGSGVVAVDGKMVDAPIVKRAEHILDLAGRAGLIPKEQPCETR